MDIKTNEVQWTECWWQCFSACGSWSTDYS